MPTTVFFTGDVTVEVPDTTSIIDGGSIALSVQKPKTFSELLDELNGYSKILHRNTKLE